MAELPTADQFINPNTTEGQFKAALKILVENVVSKDLIRSNAPPSWFKTSTTTRITFDANTRTLAWDSNIFLNINPGSLNSRPALSIPAFSITIPNDNYEVVWINLAAIPSSGVFDPANVIRVGRYTDTGENSYKGLAHQLPIFGFSFGVPFSLNGFFEGEIEGVSTGALTRLSDSLKQYMRPANPATWFPVGANVNINYDSSTRTLSWDGSILLNINTDVINKRSALVIPAFSITIPNSTYEVVWIDLSAIPSTGTVDPSLIVKVGRYQDAISNPATAFIGASHQLPIFGYTYGRPQSLNGFFEGEINGVRSKQLTTLKSEIDAEIANLDIKSSSISSASSTYLNDGKIYEVAAAGPRVFDDISPVQYLASHKVANSTVTHASVASIAAQTSFAISRLSNEIKRITCADDLLIILPSYGQSNCVGVGGAGVGGPLPEDFMYNNPYPDRLYMFANLDVRLGYIRELNNIVNPSSLTDFQSLKTVIDSANCGTSVIEGMGRALARQTELMGINSKILCYTSGRGASLLSELVSGTVPYTNLMTGIQRGVWVALQKGMRGYVPAIAFVHGEADHNNPNYLTELLAFYTQLNIDVKARTGQTADVQLLVSQPSSFFSSLSGVLGLYEAAKQNPNIHLVGAGYNCTYISDFLHYNPRGHYKLGEYFGKAVSNIVVGKKYLPMMPTNVVKTSANTVDVTFNCVGDLVADTTVTAKNSDWGLQLFNGSTQVTITSKVISGNKITLTTDAVLGSGRVDYAMQGQSSPRTADNMPRGQLRDSSTYPSLMDGSALYNWCVHFRENFNE